MDFLALWGKTGPDQRYHPLLYHLLDSGAVTHAVYGALYA